MKVFWTKLYHRVQEGELVSGIVSYSTYPMAREYRTGKPSSIMHNLYIDLWIVKLRFNWVHKMTKEQIKGRLG
jgi:hypothetical protein